MGRPRVLPRPAVLDALRGACGGLVTDRLLVAVTQCRRHASLPACVCRLRALGYDVRRDKPGRGYYLPGASP
jgi:hypothetical protein